MLDFNKKDLVRFSSKHLKVFIGTFLAVFIIVALQHTKTWIPKPIFPIAIEPDIFFDTVTPKLEMVPNTFEIKTEHNFIPRADASDEFEEAKAYAVVDYQNGRVLASKNLDQKLSIASLTKIMTSVVALDLADPSESFSTSDKASIMVPTKIGVTPGEKLTLNELLHASLLTSANDAVEVIKEGIDKKYGEEVFIRAMNEKARVIGLKNSSFSNPQGFDNKDHFSTVSDLAVLTHYALENYPEIRDIVQKDYALLSSNNYHKRFDLNNWNGLIGVYPGASGVKIGNTGNAGSTTAVVAERSGKKLIVVMLGAPAIIKRDLWAAQLLDLGFNLSLGLAHVDVTEKQLKEKYATWRYWN